MDGWTDGTSTYLVGALTGNALGGTQYGTHSTANDAVIAKFDNTGAYLWSCALGGAGASNTTFPKIYSVGSKIHVKVQTDGTVGGTLVGSASGFDYGIAQFDPSGTMDWVTQVGGGGSLDIGTLTGSNFQWVGTITQVIGTQQGTHGTQDLYIAVAPTATGVPSILQIGGGAATSVNIANLAASTASVTSDGSSNIYACGYTTGTIGTFYSGASHGTQDAFFMKISAGSTSPAWTYQMGVSGGTVSCKGLKYSSSTGRLHAFGSTNVLLGTQYGSLGTVDIFAMQLSPADGSEY